MRATCVLNLDSPSYPPTKEEYVECGCRACLADLELMDLPKDRPTLMLEDDD